MTESAEVRRGPPSRFSAGFVSESAVDRRERRTSTHTPRRATQPTTPTGGVRSGNTKEKGEVDGCG